MYSIFQDMNNKSQFSVGISKTLAWNVVQEGSNIALKEQLEISVHSTIFSIIAGKPY
jgi:hypothetical protein